MTNVTAAADSVLVGIVREFLLAHRTLDLLVERWNRGGLRFADVQDFVGDDERSILFRLKEHCHVRFRSPEADSTPVRTGELFDLAVGSLFHEAMKLRENVYQREVYVPRVENLRRESGEEADSVLREFEKIVGGAEKRLAETFEETCSLRDLARQQLRRLLSDNDDNGLVARFLLENEEFVSLVFLEGLDALLADVYGSPRNAFGVAIHSYLGSAYFQAARDLLARAAKCPDETPNFDGLIDYACGMDAFLGGDYDSSLDHLERWAALEPGAAEVSYLELAHSAVARLPNIADTQGDAPITIRGRVLEEVLEAALARNGAS